MAEKIADGEDIPSVPGGKLADELRVIARIGALHRDAAPARQWGPLCLLETLGSGAFGEVFRAWEPRLQREVALKLLFPSPDHLDTDRTFAEARMLARVRHPNVAIVYGADICDGRVGVWMELIEGETLESRMRTQPAPSIEEVLEIGCQLCAAVEAVHAAGVVHGDIKPSNVMLSAGGRVVLTDFGAGVDGRAAPAPPVFGSPRWMAPELLSGSSPTPAADIYAVGGVLYWLLTGEAPRKELVLAPPPEACAPAGRAPLERRRPDLAQECTAVIERALAREPAQRYENATLLARALRSAVRKRGSAGMSVFPALTAMLAVVVFAGVWMVREAGSESHDRNPAANEAYLRGRYEWNKRTAEGFLAARDRFEEAVALAPRNAKAYAGLADAYLLLGAYGVSSRTETLSRAEAAARRALDLDPNLAAAWTSLGYVEVLKGKLEEGKAHYRRAIALDPEYATARHWYALTVVDEEPEAAIAQITRALTLEPFSRPISSDVAMVYWRAGQLARAADQFQRTVQLFPTFVEAHIQLGRVLLDAGRYGEAVERLEEARRRFGDHVLVTKELAIAYALAGRTLPARQMLEALNEIAETTRVEPWFFAQVRAALGDVDEAVAALRQFRDEGQDLGAHQLAEPAFRHVRTDPRITALMTSKPE
jgi:tetratricopeptide (TPR) repeat protein